jgi:hypothetical protein
MPREGAIIFRVALFDRSIKGVIAPSNEEYPRSLSTAQLTSASALQGSNNAKLPYL